MSLFSAHVVDSTVVLCVFFFFQAEDGIRDSSVTEFRRVLFRSDSVPGATVEAKNLDTNFVRTESTDADGHFVILNLAPGRYTLTITKQGFASVLQQNLTLTVGQVLTIPVKLKISSVTQTIATSNPPLVEGTQ